MKCTKGFEESIQEQINESAQNPSVLVNGVEFLKLLSKESDTVTKEQNEIDTKIPDKTSDQEDNTQIIKKMRDRFELLKVSKRVKKHDRER